MWFSVNLSISENLATDSDCIPLDNVYDEFICKHFRGRGLAHSSVNTIVKLKLYLNSGTLKLCFIYHASEFQNGIVFPHRYAICISNICVFSVFLCFKLIKQASDEKTFWMRKTMPIWIICKIVETKFKGNERVYMDHLRNRKS